MVDIVAIDRALSTGALDEAAARIAALPVQAYEAAPAHSLAGRLHHAHGRDHAAVECFETALALDACDLWALCMLATLRKEAGDFAAAADLFERAVAVAPEVHGLRYNCASALREAGRLDAAHGHIQRLHAQEPASRLVHLLQARTHELRGELHVAQPIYRRVAESHPAVLGAWSGLGRIARDQGEFAAAEAALPGAGVAACPPGVTDLSAELRDFGETAAVLEEIEILISAETAVAHLGGALGVRTWIPMPMTADWRWRIGAVESPWYPDVHLFRQTRPMQWDDVFASIGAALDLHRGRG